MAELQPRERFLKIYANLPIGVRNEIVLVFPSEDDKSWKPVTWNAAYIEINNKTELGYKFLEYLVALQII